MPIIKQFNAQNFEIPTAGEVSWSNLTDYLSELADFTQVKTFQYSSVKTVTSTPVTLNPAQDYAALVNTTLIGAPSEVLLPEGNVGQRFSIADIGDNATAFPITIKPEMGQTIDGMADVVISENNTGIELIFRGENDWAILNKGSTDGLILVDGIIINDTTPNTLIGVDSNKRAVSASVQLPLIYNNDTLSIDNINRGLLEPGAANRLLRNNQSGNITSSGITVDSNENISNVHDLTGDGSGVISGFNISIVDLALDNLKLGNGNQQQPSLTFTDDTNTGIFRNTSDQLGITTGGAARMLFLNSATISYVPMWAQVGSAGQPSYTFNGKTNMGMYAQGDDLGFTVDGQLQLALSNSQAKFVNSNQILIDAGSQARPSFSFFDNEDTGMYRSNTGRIGFAAGGKRTMEVTAGDVNIEDAYLDIRSNSTTAMIINAETAGAAYQVWRKGSRNVHAVGLQNVPSGASGGDFIHYVYDDSGTNISAIYEIQRPNAPTSASDFTWIQNAPMKFNPGITLQLPYASQYAPTIRPSGDADTGIYFGAASNISFTTNGFQRLMIQGGEIRSLAHHRFADGTQAQPGIAFALDSNTGIHHPGENRLNIVLGAEASIETSFDSIKFNVRDFNQGSGFFTKLEVTEDGVSSPAASFDRVDSPIFDVGEGDGLRFDPGNQAPSIWRNDNAVSIFSDQFLLNFPDTVYHSWGNTYGSIQIGGTNAANPVPFKLAVNTTGAEFYIPTNKGFGFYEMDALGGAKQIVKIKDEEIRLSGSNGSSPDFVLQSGTSVFKYAMPYYMLPNTEYTFRPPGPDGEQTYNIPVSVGTGRQGWSNLKVTEHPIGNTDELSNVESIEFFYGDGSSASDKPRVMFMAPTTGSGEIIYELPSAQPTVGQVLQVVSTGLNNRGGADRDNVTLLGWGAGGGGGGGGGSVYSVFGRTGNIIANTGDYTASQITQTSTREFISPALKSQIYTNQSSIASLSPSVSSNTSAISGKEDDLGNPSVSGYVLSSDTSGNRTWVEMSGGSDPLRLNNGSIAAPTYSFAGDTNTGMTRTTANQIILSTDGKADFLTGQGSWPINSGGTTKSGNFTQLGSGTSGSTALIISSNGGDSSRESQLIFSQGSGKSVISYRDTDQTLNFYHQAGNDTATRMRIKRNGTTGNECVIVQAPGTDDKLSFGINTTVPSDIKGIFSGGKYYFDTDSSLELKAGLFDGTGSIGTPGQVLSSTGTKVEWIDPAGGSVAPVSSVFGRTGTVEAAFGDYAAEQITESTTKQFIAAFEKAQITTNTGDIADNASDISSNTGSISTNAGNIASNTGNISSNTSSISTNAGNISTNTGNISNLLGDVSENVDDIASNASNISTNTGNIASNTSSISTNAGNISGLSSSKEDSLGNPSTSGYVLSSDTSGNRTWIEMTSGGGSVTDPLQLNNGSVSAPTYSFSSDPDTGMYRGSGQLVLGFGGNAKFWMDQTFNYSGQNHAFQDGIVSAPGITFVSDSDTGMYKSSSGIGFTVDGQAQLLLSSSQALFSNSSQILIDAGSKTRPSYSFFGEADDTGMFLVSGNKIGFAAGGNQTLAVGSDRLEIDGQFRLSPVTTTIMQFDMDNVTSGYQTWKDAGKNIHAVGIQNKPNGTSGGDYIHYVYDNDGSNISAIYEVSRPAEPTHARDFTWIQQAQFRIQTGTNIQLPYATQSTPTISAYSDPDTGIYMGAAGNISFTTGGLQRMKFQDDYISASARFRFADGTAAAPSMVFNSDTDTGIYKSGDGKIAFSCNGVPAMEITGGDVNFTSGYVDIQSPSATSLVMRCDTANAAYQAYYNDNKAVHVLGMANTPTGNGGGSYFHFLYDNDGQNIGEAYNITRPAVPTAASEYTFQVTAKLKALSGLFMPSDSIKMAGTEATPGLQIAANTGYGSEFYVQDGKGHGFYIGGSEVAKFLTNGTRIAGNVKVNSGTIEVEATEKDSIIFNADTNGAAYATYKANSNPLYKLGIGEAPTASGGGNFYHFVYSDAGSWLGQAYKIQRDANPTAETDFTFMVSSNFRAEEEALFDSVVKLDDGLEDSTGSLGTAGQVLSSTGTKTEWIDAGGGGGPDYYTTSGTIGGDFAGGEWKLTVVGNLATLQFSATDVSVNTKRPLSDAIIPAAYRPSTSVVNCSAAPIYTARKGYGTNPPEDNMKNTVTLYAYPDGKIGVRVSGVNTGTDGTVKAEVLPEAALTMSWII